ncbi:MAG: biotin/lipoyl-containing protein [Syntrophomonadaceae bacterium]|jgi:biotin carboxyl carrier protein|nr:biotin/lipoyl-binding protein [Syntrophomonadaceae bacterium]
MKYIVSINGKNYEVEVEKGRANIIKTTETVVVPAQVPEPPAPVPSVAVPHTPVPAALDNIGGEPLKSPLPGTILAINVNPGSVVKEGDVLFILEAMKMETEIKAPRDGVIAQIMVSKGASVATGDILLALQ